MYTTKLGHAHLKVRDLDRAIAFYRDAFHLEVTEVVAGRALWHGENRVLDAGMLRELADAPLTGAE